MKNNLPSTNPDAKFREPLRDLNHELFSSRPDAEPSEPLILLSSMFFSERLADDPTVILSPTVRAFNTELARPRLSEKALNNEI